MTSIDHLLVDTCTIQRSVPVHIGGGRFRDEMTAIATGVKTRIAAMRTPQEQTPAEQQVTYMKYAGYFLPTQGIQRDDLVLATSGHQNGKTFRVTGTTDPSLPHHRRVELEEIQRA